MEKETRSNRVGDPFSASSVGGETMATELTELPKEMRGSRLDQSKLKTKVDLGLAEQMAVLKSQVDQFEQLVLSMGNKIKGMSRVDSCGGASDTSSIYIYILSGGAGSWIHVTGKPCCYLPDIPFSML